MSISLYHTFFCPSNLGRRHTSDIPIHNGNLPKTNAELIKSDMSAPNVNSENMLDTALPSKSMPKTKESYIRSHGKAPSDLIKTPERAKAMPKQNAHTVTRNVSTGTKKAVKTKDSLLKGTNKAVKTVSAEGSKTTGTKRPFGLDCSGFVTWSFINSGFNASQIGHGTKGQIAKCSRISWGNVQAGNLAFYGDLSHVGIVSGKDADGNILVIHCSSGNNNVVITTNSGFGFAARPGFY